MNTRYTTNGLQRLAKQHPRTETTAEVIAVSHWYGLHPRAVRAMRGTPALGRMIDDLPGDYDSLPYRSRAAERRQERKLAAMFRGLGLFNALKVVLLVALLVAIGFMLGVIDAKHWY